jgi:hypothetical protein
MDLALDKVAAVDLLDLLAAQERLLPFQHMVGMVALMEAVVVPTLVALPVIVQALVVQAQSA